MARQQSWEGSFASFLAYNNKLPFPIDKNFTVPGSRVSNVRALRIASGKITIGSYSFAKMGREIDGASEETQELLRSLILT